MTDVYTAVAPSCHGQMMSFQGTHWKCRTCPNRQLMTTGEWRYLGKADPRIFHNITGDHTYCQAGRSEPATCWLTADTPAGIAALDQVTAAIRDSQHA